MNSKSTALDASTWVCLEYNLQWVTHDLQKYHFMMKCNIPWMYDKVKIITTMRKCFLVKITNIQIMLKQCYISKKYRIWQSLWNHFNWWWLISMGSKKNNQVFMRVRGINKIQNPWATTKNNDFTIILSIINALAQICTCKNIY